MVSSASYFVRLLVPFQTKEHTEATVKPGRAAQSAPQLQKPRAVCQPRSPLWPGGGLGSLPASPLPPLLQPCGSCPPSQWVCGVTEPWGSPLHPTSASPSPASPSTAQVSNLLHGPCSETAWVGSDGSSLSQPPAPPLPQVPPHPMCPPGLENAAPAGEAGHSPGGHASYWAHLLPQGLPPGSLVQLRLSPAQSSCPPPPRPAEAPESSPGRPLSTTVPASSARALPTT